MAAEVVRLALALEARLHTQERRTLAALGRLGERSIEPIAWRGRERRFCEAR